MEDMNDLRLAVLIDADNVPYSNIKGVIEEIALYGTPTFKRILRGLDKTHTIRVEKCAS